MTNKNGFWALQIMKLSYKLKEKQASGFQGFLNLYILAPSWIFCCRFFGSSTVVSPYCDISVLIFPKTAWSGPFNVPVLEPKIFSSFGVMRTDDDDYM